MISAFALFMLGTSLVVDPAIENDPGHETVTVLPSQTFVLCDDNCFQPTPKRKKIVLKRAINKSVDTTYAKINDYLKNQQVKVIHQQKPTEALTYIVHFELNSSVISKKEQAELLKWINKVKAEKYEALGYTCQIGTEKHNKTLSDRRAVAVQKYIESKFKQSYIKAKGMGMGHYISTKNIAMNRRVEIKASHAVHTVIPGVKTERTEPSSLKVVTPVKQTEPAAALSTLTTIKVKKQPVKIIRIETTTVQSQQKQKPTETSIKEEREKAPVTSGVMPAEKEPDKIRVLKANKTQSKENIE